MQAIQKQENGELNCFICWAKIADKSISKTPRRPHTRFILQHKVLAHAANSQACCQLLAAQKLLSVFFEKRAFGDFPSCCCLLYLHRNCNSKGAALLWLLGPHQQQIGLFRFKFYPQELPHNNLKLAWPYQSYFSRQKAPKHTAAQASGAPCGAPRMRSSSFF